MQNRRQSIRAGVYLLGRAGTGVVRHHAPALRGTDIHIRGQHKRSGGRFGQVQLDAFNQIVHGAGHGFYFAHMLWVGIDHAIAEHVLKRLADIVYTDQTRTARMYTHHIVVIRPARHEFVDITFLQGFVKRSFDLVS